MDRKQIVLNFCSKMQSIIFLGGNLVLLLFQMVYGRNIVKDPEEYATIPSWMLDEDNTKIVGGNYADAPIPWQVFLTVVFTTSRGSRSYMCGGTIIDEETILTAAHCITKSDKRVDLDE